MLPPHHAFRRRAESLDRERDPRLLQVQFGIAKPEYWPEFRIVRVSRSVPAKQMVGRRMIVRADLRTSNRAREFIPLQ